MNESEGAWGNLGERSPTGKVGPAPCTHQPCAQGHVCASDTCAHIWILVHGNSSLWEVQLKVWCGIQIF